MRILNKMKLRRQLKELEEKNAVYADIRGSVLGMAGEETMTPEQAVQVGACAASVLHECAKTFRVIADVIESETRRMTPEEKREFYSRIERSYADADHNKKGDSHR